MSSHYAATRIGIFQFIVFFMLTYISVTLALTLDEEDGPHFHVTRRGFLVISGCFVYPLFLSCLLLCGICKKKKYLVRIWLLSNILLTIVLLFLLLSGAIYVAITLKIYWGVFLCSLPFVMALWMAEGMIVVNAYYKSLDNQDSKINHV